MVELCHPHSKALYHCIDDIIRVVQFTDVALKLYEKNIISLDEYERLHKLPGHENAIEKVVNKMIYSADSYSNYTRFLEVLTKMSTEQPQYAELRDNITAEHERLQNEFEIVQVRTPPIIHSPLTSSLSYGGDIDTISTASIESMAGMIVNYEPTAMISKFNQKTIIGKTFTEYLIYLCKLFLKAIDNGAVRLVRDAEQHKEYIKNEVAGSITILNGIMEKFSSADKEQEDDLLQYALIPILLVRASRIVDIIRQPFWVWPASNMNILLSLCDGMVEVVKGTRDIDHTSFCQLIGHIQQLRGCLDSADAMLQRMFKSQLILTITLGAGAVICFILGAAFMCTPLNAASVPLLVAGGVLTWQTLVQAGLIVRDVINEDQE